MTAPSVGEVSLLTSGCSAITTADAATLAGTGAEAQTHTQQKRMSHVPHRYLAASSGGGNELTSYPCMDTTRWGRGQ